MGLFSWLKRKKAKEDAEEATGAFELASQTSKSEVGKAEAVAAEVKEKPSDIKQISVGGKNILFAKQTEEHIMRHNQPGEGSVFRKSMGFKKIQEAFLQIPGKFFEQGGGVYTSEVPNAGYNLVQKATDIERAYPGAKKIMIKKQIGFDREKKQPIMKAVPGYVIKDSKEKFVTNKFNLVIRPSNPDYMSDELKNDPEVSTDLSKGNSFSVLTAFPGDPDVPTADKWEESGHAIIVPNGGRGADKSNWVSN
tara:strand:- start:48 stop:800 length:753 start_codon:yes stop_codon:yes gene_type:complete